MFKFLFTYINKFECVKKYEGGRKWEDPNTWDARKHINLGCLYAILTSLSGFIHPLFLLSYVMAFLLWSPLMELWFQYYKEKDKFVWNVMAQMFERGIGFVFFLPVAVIVLVVSLVFNIRLI